MNKLVLAIAAFAVLHFASPAHAQSRAEVLETIRLGSLEDPTIAAEWSGADARSRIGKWLYTQSVVLTPVSLALLVAGWLNGVCISCSENAARENRAESARYFTASTGVFFAAMLSLGFAIGLDIDSASRHRRAYRRAQALTEAQLSNIRFDFAPTSDGAVAGLHGTF